MHEFSALIKVYDGIRETVEHLHRAGIRLGIVTSRIREELGYDIIPSGLLPLFETNVCYEDTAEHKLHPEPLQLFLKNSNLNDSEVLFIDENIYYIHCGDVYGGHSDLALRCTLVACNVTDELQLE